MAASQVEHRQPAEDQETDRQIREEEEDAVFLKNNNQTVVRLHRDILRELEQEEAEENKITGGCCLWVSPARSKSSPFEPLEEYAVKSKCSSHAVLFSSQNLGTPRSRHSIKSHNSVSSDVMQPRSLNPQFKQHCNGHATSIATGTCTSHSKKLSKTKQQPNFWTSGDVISKAWAVVLLLFFIVLFQYHGTPESTMQQLASSSGHQTAKHTLRLAKDRRPKKKSMPFLANLLVESDRLRDNFEPIF